MINPATFDHPLGPPRGLAIDSRALDAVRARAATDPKGTVREAARQFAALFMNELMKSMRAAVPDSGTQDNAASNLGSDMLDQQYAHQLTGMKGGLSEAIMRQLERQMGMTPGPIPVTGSANNTPAPLVAPATSSVTSLAVPPAPPPAPTRLPQIGAAGFVQQHDGAAKMAEAATGIPAAFMVSQAALETGWGRKEIRHVDGSPSFNLFGIKAGGAWKGPVAEVVTTEFINGRAQKVVAQFRAYGSYAESFADYARLMKNSPRYAGVVAGAGTAQGFAQGLQRAGYATDPAYADKLSRVINTTIRLQRTGVA